MGSATVLLLVMKSFPSTRNGGTDGGGLSSG